MGQSTSTTSSHFLPARREVTHCLFNCFVSLVVIHGFITVSLWTIHELPVNAYFFIYGHFTHNIGAVLFVYICHFTVIVWTIFRWLSVHVNNLDDTLW